MKPTRAAACPEKRVSRKGLYRVLAICGIMRPVKTHDRQEVEATIGASSNGAPNSIEVTGLCKSYGSVEAVSGVDFSVASGEIFGMLGPNGAGKSTIISMLCTLVGPTGGEANVAGFKVTQDPSRVRRNIGLVFQETTLDFYLTATENLRFHAELYGIPSADVAERIREVLELVGLADRREDPVRVFSGGMKRRLEIARGLLHFPHVLFLDEPTLGLDPQSRAHIWDYIRQVKQTENVTIFVTTHYMEEAENCDRVAIIDHGRLVALDSPESLKAAVGKDRIQLRASDGPACAGLIRESFGLEVSQDEDGVVFYVERGEEFLPRLLSRLDGVESVTLSRPSLEDVFLAYTGRTICEEERPKEASFLRSAISAKPGAQGRATGFRRLFARSAAKDDSARAGPVPSAGAPSLSGELRALKMVWRRDMIRFFRSRARVLSTMTQPLLILFVMGTGLATMLPSGGGADFRTFLFAGVLGISVLFPSVFSAISIVSDREYGFLREMLVAPVLRSTILAGKCLSGATMATLQGIAVLALGGLVGLSYHPGLMLALTAEMLLLSAALTAFALMIATRLTQTDSFTAVIGFVVFPMFYFSGGLFPVAGLPRWLTALTLADPLTYGVDAMRRTAFYFVNSPQLAEFNSPVRWGSYELPIAVEIGLVALFGAWMFRMAVSRFSRAE